MFSRCLKTKGTLNSVAFGQLKHEKKKPERTIPNFSAVYGKTRTFLGVSNTAPTRKTSFVKRKPHRLLDRIFLRFVNTSVFRREKIPIYSRLLIGDDDISESIESGFVFVSIPIPLLLSRR